VNPNFVQGAFMGNSLELQLDRKETMREDSMRIMYSNKEYEGDPVTVVLYLRVGGVNSGEVHPGIRRFKCVLVPIETDTGGLF